MRLLFSDRLACVGVALIVVVLMVGLLAPYLAPYPEQGRGQSNLTERFEAPNGQHLLGTDNYGRDVLSRIIYGARIPLVMGGAVLIGCLGVGVPLGGVAGYYGGRVDEAIMRVTDVFLAFPSVLLAIALVAFIGPSLKNTAIALIICWWPWYARLVRGITVSTRTRQYVESARVSGVSNLTVVRRHILPATIGPVVVSASLDLGAVIISAAALSFIGLGAQPPTAEWGLMMNEGRPYILDAWWIATFPALAMFVLVLSTNLLGDGLRDALDPRSIR